MHRPEGLSFWNRWVLFALLAGVAGTLFLIYRHSQNTAGLPATPSQTNESNPVASSGKTIAPWEIAQAKILKATLNPSQARRALEELRQYLSTLPNDEASRVIRQVLDKKTDARTGGGFTLGANGFLADTPSFRVFLLDYLGKVDPAAAAAYAEKILGSMDSADEWAVAMRSYAWGNNSPEGRSFLEQKLQAMLTYAPWQQEASAGFLEGFDVAVYLGGTKLTPTLTSLVRQTENRAVSHAAYLALDRLVISEPAALLDKLQSEPDLMIGREATRANYFARAQVGDQAQRQVVEKYLLDPQIGESELNTFAGLFPNENYMISHNLLTKPQTPNHNTLVARDQAALQTVEGWLADPRFARVQPQLATIKNRLSQFVKQAGGQ